MVPGEGRRVERWMPRFDVRSWHEQEVGAKPARAYAAVRRVDLAEDPLVRALFAVRGLLRPRRPRRAFTLDGFVAAGFTLLEEVPGREIVLGLTGRFWRPSGALVPLEPGAFTAFDEPGWAQAVWGFAVVPSGVGSIVSTETRCARPTRRHAARSAATGGWWRRSRDSSAAARSR